MPLPESLVSLFYKRLSLQQSLNKMAVVSWETLWKQAWTRGVEICVYCKELIKLGYFLFGKFNQQGQCSEVWKFVSIPSYKIGIFFGKFNDQHQCRMVWKFKIFLAKLTTNVSAAKCANLSLLQRVNKIALFLNWRLHKLCRPRMYANFFIKYKAGNSY